jgi:hypothetical protein
MGRTICTNGSFLPFNLKDAPTEFQRVMDQVLAGLGLAKCYIDDIIVFSLTQEITCTICKRCLEDLRNITLSFIQANVSSFILKWNTWVT